jgi:hypothetical protein
VRLEAKSKALVDAIECERVAEALHRLSDDELDRLEQQTLAGLADACWKGLIARSVDELVAQYRSAIAGQ